MTVDLSTSQSSNKDSVSEYPIKIQFGDDLDVHEVFCLSSSGTWAAALHHEGFMVHPVISRLLYGHRMHYKLVRYIKTSSLAPWYLRESKCG